jgi:hypothetical protein
MQGYFSIKAPFFYFLHSSQQYIAHHWNFDPLANEIVLTGARISSSPKKVNIRQNV